MLFCSGSGLQRQRVQESSPSFTLLWELVLQILMPRPGFALGASTRRLPREQARSFYSGGLPLLSWLLLTQQLQLRCASPVNATFHLLTTLWASGLEAGHEMDGVASELACSTCSMSSLSALPRRPWKPPLWEQPWTKASQVGLKECVEF